MSWEHKILLLKVSRHLKNKKCIYIILSYKTIDYNTVKPSVMATSLQLPLFLEDSPYIHSCFNLSTMATFFCPQGECRCREVEL